MSHEQVFGADSQQEKPKFFPLVPVTQPISAVQVPEAEDANLAPVIQTASEASAVEDLEQATPEENEPSVTEQTDSGLFEFSNKLIPDSASASIFIDELPESKNQSHVLETGEILTTGAIDISMLTANTGELSAIDAEITDAAVAVDTMAGNVSTIAPLRVANLNNFGSELGVLPTKLRRGEGQLYFALTISLALVAVGSLILAAYMLNLFN